MLAMTLLASANSPRLPRYCALAQSKHSGKSALPLVTLGGTPRGVVLGWVSECCPVSRHPRASWHRGRAAPHRGWTDGQMDGWMDRGDPSALGRGARAAMEGARMAAGGFGDMDHQHSIALGTWVVPAPHAAQSG